MCVPLLVPILQRKYIKRHLSLSIEGLVGDHRLIHVSPPEIARTNWKIFVVVLVLKEWVRGKGWRRPPGRLLRVWVVVHAFLACLSAMQFGIYSHLLNNLILLPLLHPRIIFNQIVQADASYWLVQNIIWENLRVDLLLVAAHVWRFGEGGVAVDVVVIIDVHVLCAAELGVLLDVQVLDEL